LIRRQGRKNTWQCLGAYPDREMSETLQRKKWLLEADTEAVLVRRRYLIRGKIDS
jgi:hypothetical protein